MHYVCIAVESRVVVNCIKNIECRTTMLLWQIMSPETMQIMRISFRKKYSNQ